MEKITKRLTETSTWAEDTALTPINLPREGLITEIKVRHAITLDSAATTSVDPDGLYRALFEYLEIEGNGGRSYLSAVGEQMGRLLGLWNLFEFGVPFLTTVDGTTESPTFVFHPGSNPKDPFDMSAVIPASALSTLQAKVRTCSDDEVINNAGSNDGVASGTYYYEVNEVMGVPVPKGIMTPLGSTLTWPHDSNYSAFAKKIDIPAGAWLRRIIMLVQDATAVSTGTSTGPLRKDDEITGVRLELPRAANKIILEETWEDLKVEAAKLYAPQAMPFSNTDDDVALQGIPDGFAIIDLRKYFHPIWGMDLTRYQTGDVKLGLTVENIASGDDTIIYWDQLAPVESELVGK